MSSFVVATGTAEFGPFVTGGDVEGWVFAELQTWFSTYLAEAERRAGYSGHDLPRPRSWAIGPTPDKWPEDQIPAVYVSSSGVPAPPQRDGEGYYRARWLIEPGVVCSARTQAETHALAMLYGAALRWVIAQRPSLGGNAESSDWLGERYEDVSYDDSRSLYACRETFSVEVVDVMQTGVGPTSVEVPFTPDDTLPWPPDVEVESVELELDNVTVDQSLPEEG